MSRACAPEGSEEVPRSYLSGGGVGPGGLYRCHLSIIFPPVSPRTNNFLLPKELTEVSYEIFPRPRRDRSPAAPWKYFPPRFPSINSSRPANGGIIASREGPAAWRSARLRSYYARGCQMAHEDSANKRGAVIELRVVSRSVSFATRSYYRLYSWR